MALVPITQALGAYYAPRAFSGALEIADNYVKKGMDKLCDVNSGLCTTGALTRKEKKELARLQQAQSSMQMVPRNMSTALVPFRGGGVQAHIAATRKLSSGAAKFKSVRGKTVVAHTEFVDTAIAASNVFATQGPIECNPTNALMFPWLSTIAGSYDKYRFTRMQIEYVPIVPTTFAGRVGLIFDYDSQDTAPVSRADCYSYVSSVEGPVWDRLLLNVKCDNTIRYTDSTSTIDKKLVDLGSLFIFTDAASAGVVGDVLVHFTIELIEPQPNPTLSTQRFANSGSGGVPGGAGAGANLVTLNGNYASFTITFVSPGDYAVVVASGGGTMSGTVAISLSGATNGANAEAVSTTTALGWFNVRVPLPGGQVTLNGWTSTAPGNQFLVVTKLGRNDFF